MFIRNIIQFVADSFKNIKRNKVLSITTIITITITFYVLGLFLLIGVNINKSIEAMAKNIEIQVYLKDDIETDERIKFQESISKEEGIKSIVYETKNTAFINLKKSLKNNEMLLQGYDLNNNPLMNSLIIKINEIDKVDTIIENISQSTLVDSISNQKEIIDKIKKAGKASEIIAIAVFALLYLVSLFLVVNTLRLTVNARKKEIEVMKLVGASDWFIRCPFLIEGMVIGTIGATINSILLIFSYKGIYSFLSSVLKGFSLIQPQDINNWIFIVFLIAGIFIGIFGSFITVRKHLKI